MTELRLVTQSVRDAEDAILSAILIDAPFAIEECRQVGLGHTTFTDHRNALLYRAMLYLHREGKAVDPVILAHVLEEHGKLEEVGGRSQIGLLLSAIPTAANVRFHAQIVRDAAEFRAGEYRAKHEAV